MITSKFFGESEFKRCSPSCSLQDMDQGFMNKLDLVREYAGIPLAISSANRPVPWELAKGRSGKGDHPQGKGVDIKCNASTTRWKIVNAAIKAGFTRIGIAKSFVHVGCGENLATCVIWTY